MVSSVGAELEPGEDESVPLASKVEVDVSTFLDENASVVGSWAFDSAFDSV
jgi:hypothetical protein